MKRELEPDDWEPESGVRHVRPTFFFTELVRAPTSILDCEVSACDKGWVAVVSDDTMYVFDADLKLRVQFTVEGGLGSECRIDLLVERKLLLVQWRVGYAIFSFAHGKLEIRYRGGFHYQIADIKMAGACLSLCGRFMLEMGPAISEDGLQLDVDMAVNVWDLEKNQIVSTVVVEGAGLGDYEWTVRLRAKHLRYHNDSWPVIVYVVGESSNLVLLRYMYILENGKISTGPKRLAGDLEASLEELRNSEAWELEYDESVFVKEEEGGDEIRIDSAVRHTTLAVGREATQDEAVGLTLDGEDVPRLARIVLRDSKIIRELGQVRGTQPETCHFLSMFRGALGRLIMHEFYEKKLILFHSGDFLDPEYYRLPWRPEVHDVFPSKIRRRVEMFALCLRRLNVFPKDLRRLLLRFQVIDF